MADKHVLRSSDEKRRKVANVVLHSAESTMFLLQATGFQRSVPTFYLSIFREVFPSAGLNAAVW